MVGAGVQTTKTLIAKLFVDGSPTVGRVAGSAIELAPGVCGEGLTLFAGCT